MDPMRRVSTGIPGMDEMLGGGLIRGRPYIIEGGPGSGKSIFGTQFLMHGARNGEMGLYISFEESKSEIIENMSIFGWNLLDKNIKILDETPDTGSDTWKMDGDSIVHVDLSVLNIVKLIKKQLIERTYERVVIDSLTSIKLVFPDERVAYKELVSLMKFLSQSNMTSIVTTDMMDSSNKFLIEDFLARGVIRLHKIEQRGELVSAINIEKMRGTNFDRHIRPMKISDQGITVYSQELLLR